VTVTALLSLGGNLGDRKAAMDEAVRRIEQSAGEVLARSAYYRTVPDGPIAQPWFLNIAATIATTLLRDELARACRDIETALGRDRTREIPWGPRIMDIDVVAYGAASAIDPRPYVLIPAAEIVGDLRIGASTLHALAAAADATGVEKLDWPVPAPAGRP
jgi:2-amino-4-hydroxy-6-hydroxymethyldihydropteridine diphosphokinase